MKKGIIFSQRFSSVFLVSALLGMLALLLGVSQTAYGTSTREIDASVEAALDRFHSQVEGAESFTKVAKGFLVMPNVKKAAFIIGGEYGEGALIVNNETVDYYNIVSGSFGLQIGAQAKDVLICFMTEDALAGFQNSYGWEVGVDGNVAFMHLGGGERIDTTTFRDPIVGFVFDVAGLMADVSFKGAKFTKMEQVP